MHGKWMTVNTTLALALPVKVFQLELYLMLHVSGNSICKRQYMDEFIQND